MSTYDDEDGSLYDEFLYGEGLLYYYPPELFPEDARSVVAELYPTRVNWVGNPGFSEVIDGDPVTTWNTINVGRYDNGFYEYDTAELIYDSNEIYPLDNTEVVADSDVPWVNYAAKVRPGTGLRFSDLSDLQYAIPVMVREGEDKPFVQYQKNLWKFTALVRREEYPDNQYPPEGVLGGVLVLRTDGSRDLVLSTTTPKPFPWDRFELFELEVTDPLSSTGWYCIYEVLDLGPDAVWAIPVIFNDSVDKTTFITGISVERWDEVTLLQGTGLNFDGGQDQNVGEGRSDVIPYWDWDWTQPDLIAMDPLVYFDGDSSNSTRHDFVWLSIGDHQVSGYYPQRRERVDGLRNLLREWLPVGRTANVKYAIETPRIRRPSALP